MERSLRILLIPREYEGVVDRGGIGKYARVAARSYADLGHEVTVAVEAGEAKDSYLLDGIRILPVVQRTPRFLRLPRWMSFPGWIPAFALAVRRSVAGLGTRFDIVEAAENTAAALAIAIRDPVPVVTRLMGSPCLQIAKRDPWFDSPENRWRDRFERWQARQSRTVVATAKPQVVEIRDRYRLPAQRVRAVPFPIGRIPGSGAPSNRGGGSGSSLVFVGRLVPEKGLTSLLRCFLRIRSDHPDLRLTAVAAGGLGWESDLAREVESLVGRAGGAVDLVRSWTPMEELLPVIRNCVAVVIPSTRDWLPYVALESLANGALVVTRPVGALGPLLGEHRGGIVAESMSEAALEAAIREAVALDSAGRGRLREGAAELLRMADPDRVAREMVGIFREILGHSVAASAISA